MTSVGIYPGTFDPIHEGHLSFAKMTLRECSLDMVYLVPEKNPRHKSNVTDLGIRTDTIHDALTQTHGLGVISLTSDRFTISATMPEIEAQLGPASFTLLLGSDVAKKLENWPHVETLLKSWRLAIGMRIRDKAEDIEKVIEKIEKRHGISVDRTFIYTDKSDVSSSVLRDADRS